MNELLPPFEDSQGCYQWNDHVILFALALDAPWPLVHLLDLYHHLADANYVGAALPPSSVALLRSGVAADACCSVASGTSVEIGAAGT